MNQSRKRLGIILFLLLWFFLVSLPALAFILATRGQLQLGDEYNHLRVFMLQENAAEGIGIEIVRPFRSVPTCTQSNVRYFMWVGDPENVTFCQCYDAETGAPLSAIQGNCVEP